MKLLPALKNTHIDIKRNLLKSINTDIKRRAANDKKIKEGKRGVP